MFTFSFGGSETETIELVRAADPCLLKFTGVAVGHPLPLPQGEPPKDGSFPPLYMPANSFVDASDPRVLITSDFREAVEMVMKNSDVIISWGVPEVATYLPVGKRTKLVVQSKDSGEWARSFLSPGSLSTRFCVANSTLAASAFPDAIRERVKVIHDGINPDRVVPRISRIEQRRLWDLASEDKIVGYLGRIEENKGVSKTVEGLALLPENWKAVFIGLNPNSSYSEKLFRHCEARIPGRYRLIDWCHDVGSALSALDVFCHPSDHEGFSNSLGEAWLAGVPTIYTRDTGAVVDLGDLGIPVSMNADGPEIANAILRAFGNVEIVARARKMIKHAYVTEHYVQRWTEYLLAVYQQTEKPRVLLLFPGNLTGKIFNWLSTITQHSTQFDPCCLAIQGAHELMAPAAKTEIYRRYGCPVFYVSSERDVETLIAYTRPDLVLTFPGSTSELIPARSFPPVLVVSADSASDSGNWAAWLNSLSALKSNHALSKSAE